MRDFIGHECYVALDTLVRDAVGCMVELSCVALIIDDVSKGASALDAVVGLLMG